MPNTCVNYEKKCGGCPLLALPYREQLAKKQARLQELLGGFAPVKAVQGMARAPTASCPARTAFCRRKF